MSRDSEDRRCYHRRRHHGRRTAFPHDDADSIPTAREIDERDQPGSTPLAMVSERLAWTFFGNRIRWAGASRSRTISAISKTKDAQSKLLVQAVTIGNAETACKNLRFFLELGLLDNFPLIWIAVRTKCTTCAFERTR